jgi:hypothetical protein
MGGLAPIVDSSVTLYAAGATGYGSGAASIGSASTAADGSFTVASYACPMGNPQTYITANGGSAGSGANSAIALMAALGPCNSLSTATHVTINELTTAAAQWALAQFFDSSGHNIGTSSTNTTGLKNAYTGVANLADVSASSLSVSGNPSSVIVGSCPGAGNCDALERLNTLSNILAGCIESSGPSASACSQLMCDATPGLTYTSSCSGTPAITDTMAAAHLIVTNPANNASALYGLAAASTPFGPALGTPPQGWEIALNLAPWSAALDEPVSVALDGFGNVFVANQVDYSVSELTAASGYASGLNFAPPGAAFDNPYAIALDASGNVFAANLDGNSVSELTAASTYATGYNFSNPKGAAFEAPFALALDGSGNVLVANDGGDSVIELIASAKFGAAFTFAPKSAELNHPVSLALDGSGNIFAANAETNSVSELLAAGGYATGLNFAPSGAGFNVPIQITLDAMGNVFVANQDIGTVSELTASSNYGTGAYFIDFGVMFNNSPNSLALDGSGNIFVVGNNVSSELTAASGYATGFNFAPAAARFDEPDSVALDASGNVFVANENNASVSEVLGLAKPVITPVQSCVIYWTNHPGQACVP